MRVPLEMDADKIIQKETVKDIPPVPIKTYKWEDIRRQKKKGLYPYTYLNKETYNGEVDPSEHRMDTLRTSKSASVLEKSSSGVNIQDITENKEGNGSKDYLDVNVANEGIVETADSSNEDNLSQYLDKDDDPPVIIEHIETPGPSKEEEQMETDDEQKQNERTEEEKMEIDDEQKQRAKSEEPKRKRKLSIESSYSRISLSKLGVMKKLREAKDKLKLPKFSFSKSESKLDIPKKAKRENKKSSGKVSTKKTSPQSYFEPKKDETPVYIHIPLKPPPGQTDEFSYLEFEDPTSDIITKPTDMTTDKSDQEKVNNSEPPEQKEQEGVQFIILTAPSDDERLDDQVVLPDSPSLDNGKKFFDNAKLKELKSLAKGCVDEIPSDIPIEGIIFEDVIQVEYVDEHNRPIGTTETSNIVEITQENLPKIEKQLSQRNLVKELEKEIASSMDSLNKIARQNTLKKLKDQQKSRSNEALKKIESNIQRTQEAPELSTAISSVSKSDEIKVKPEEIKIEKSTDEKKEVPKEPKEKPQVEESKNKAMFDEEDGLKLSEAAIQMINEELAKEKLPKTNEEQMKAASKPGSIKKKVSFRRRSKQEDPHGIYEDVRVTSDSKSADGKEQQTKELKVIESSQSMSVDEEKTYLDDKIIKTTSLEEDYNKWSKLNDHEYEPVNPPIENENQRLPAPQIQISDASIESTESQQSKHPPPDSVRIPPKGEDIGQSDEDIDSGDALTVEEMQARIEDQFFNNASSSLQEDSTTATTVATITINNKESKPQESQTKKFQDAFKAQAGKLRTKIKNIRKPNIQMPQRPNLERFKLQKPNINMPKIPDQMRVSLPSFTLPKRDKSAKKRPIKQYSTESNVGDSKKKLFDFSTYPRIFGKKKKKDELGNDDFAESATVPRTKKSSRKHAKDSRKGKETEEKKMSPVVIRIRLHPEESMDKEENDLSSHCRYGEKNIDIDDDYLRETHQMNIASAFNSNDFSRNRWNHGSFHGHNLNEIASNENEIASNESEIKATDLNAEMERVQTSSEPELEPELELEPRQSDVRSTNGSEDVLRPGVLEKINSDEYFMQMGNYLNAEISEAFKQPTNLLAKWQNDDSFDREFDVSDQSVQEVPKRRPLKKPKRKKTPNVSREYIPCDQESEPEEYQKPFEEQPERPKRKGKLRKKMKEDKPPYQLEFEIMRKSASDNILLSEKKTDDNYHNQFRQEYPQFYENEIMQGIEQPNILISDPYQKKEFQYIDDSANLDKNENLPEAPPRKERSLKSLVSEHDSFIDEVNYANQNLPQQNIEAYRMEHEYIIPTPEESPVRPVRTRSRTHSLSKTTNQRDDEPPVAIEFEAPCVEEPCVQQICDYMGYAVIEKNRHREPPLPPPTRRKRSNAPMKSGTKFFTVPRPLKEETPVRPVRNYSTLVPKNKRSSSNLDEEEKENIDLGQYIEIDDEEGHSRLQSGDIVQKMKDRPLPAPPRPPRKTKDLDKDAPFEDITYRSNVEEDEPVKEKLEEAEVSVQTEPLPDDLVCEEFVQEKGDKIITPTTCKSHPLVTEFENVETVTHGALVVAPVCDDFQEGPITSFSRSTEKITTIWKEIDHEKKTSNVHDGFEDLKEPQAKIIERIIERPIPPNVEVDILKAQKLQVTDLDVDRLTVNELLASKIKVSEIDSDVISVSEINPKSGNLVIGGLELPVNFIHDIMQKLAKPQSPADDHSAISQQSTENWKNEETNVKTETPSKENYVALLSKDEDTDLSSKEKDQQLPLEAEQDSLLSKDENKVIPSEQNKDQELPLKSEETVPKVESEKLLSKKTESIEENFNKVSELKKQLSSETDPELSPTSIKTTIEYLDNLIREQNIELNLEEKVENIVQSDLKSTMKSTNEVLIEENTTAAGSSPVTKQSSSEEKSENVDLEEIPPLVSDTSEEERLIEELKSGFLGQKKTPFEEQLDEPPKRPPRQSDVHKLQQSQEDIFIPSQIIENSQNFLLGEMTPPPRPPDPAEQLYLRSQPPPSFYILRPPTMDDFIDENIPMPPRRKRAPKPPSQSSSEEALPMTPRNRRHRTPEPSITQLTGQLTRACVTAGEKAFKRLIKHITINVLRNADGRQDLHVIILILLILIAGLILLGNGDNPIVHHHHWEYFNPPKDL